MNTLNGYTDSNAADYLDEIRKYVAQNKNGKTAAANLTPEYSVFVSESVSISDSATVDPNKKEASDSVSVADTVTRTDQATGTFLIDTATIGFSDIG